MKLSTVIGLALPLLTGVVSGDMKTSSISNNDTHDSERAKAQASSPHDTRNVFGAQSQEHAIDQFLTTNAREISVFLSGANPYLPEDAVFGLLAAHGKHHITQIKQVETGAFEKEAETWAAMRKHMLVIADSIAEALAQQFPERLVSQN